MPKVVITVGISGSGKSTWAHGFVRDNPDWTIVCRDDIRLMHGLKHGENENLVTRVHRNLIEVSLEDGLNVIVADTNINEGFRNKLVKFAHEHGADVEIKVFDINLDVAIVRDSQRAASVGPVVIKRQYGQLLQQDVSDTVLPCPSYLPVVYESEKADAICVDIDGTVADHRGNRSPYDESKVIDDAAFLDVIKIVESLAESPYVVIFVSGRTDKCREDTEAWLDQNVALVEKPRLYMRESGDTRPDWVVKNEIYDEHILPEFNVVAVFDDRNQVVRHLRRRGITVMQVAPGRF